MIGCDDRIRNYLICWRHIFCMLSVCWSHVKNWFCLLGIKKGLNIRHINLGSRWTAGWAETILKSIPHYAKIDFRQKIDFNMMLAVWIETPWKHRPTSSVILREKNLLQFKFRFLFLIFSRIFFQVVSIWVINCLGSSVFLNAIICAVHNAKYGEFEESVFLLRLWLEYNGSKSGYVSLKYRLTTFHCLPCKDSRRYGCELLRRKKQPWFALNSTN